MTAQRAEMLKPGEHVQLVIAGRHAKDEEDARFVGRRNGNLLVEQVHHDVVLEVTPDRIN